MNEKKFFQQKSTQGWLTHRDWDEQYYNTDDGDSKVIYRALNINSPLSFDSKINKIHRFLKENQVCKWFLIIPSF